MMKNFLLLGISALSRAPSVALHAAQPWQISVRMHTELDLLEQQAVRIWGTGPILREFLYADDMAAACIFLLEHYSNFPHVNVGSQQELSIRELAVRVADIVG